MAPPVRVAYSPGEFAKLFGKSQTWGYREIYRGNVKAITEHGRILIPAKEVERILESAGIYNGREKPKSAPAKTKPLSAEQKSIWQRFIELRKGPGPVPTGKIGAAHLPSREKGGKNRASVVQRLSRSWGAKKRSPQK